MGSEMCIRDSSLTGWSRGMGRSNQKSCFKCQADCMDIPWTDPSKTAKWRPTAITMKTFWAWVIFTRSNVSAIFGWPGFVYDMLDADWMHTVDLGVTLIVLGNCPTIQCNFLYRFWLWMSLGFSFVACAFLPFYITKQGHLIRKYCSSQQSNLRRNPMPSIKRNM